MLPVELEEIILDYKAQLEHTSKFKHCLDEIKAITYYNEGDLDRVYGSCRVTNVEKCEICEAGETECHVGCSGYNAVMYFQYKGRSCYGYQSWGGWRFDVCMTMKEDIPVSDLE